MFDDREARYNHPDLFEERELACVELPDACCFGFCSLKLGTLLICLNNLFFGFGSALLYTVVLSLGLKNVMSGAVFDDDDAMDSAAENFPLPHEGILQVIMCMNVLFGLAYGVSTVYALLGVHYMDWQRAQVCF